MLEVIEQKGIISIEMDNKERTSAEWVVKGEKQEMWQSVSH